MKIPSFARMRAVVLVLSVMTTLVLVSGLLVATGGTAYASGTHTTSATTSADAGGTVDFAPMQKWCAVIEVHLNGAQHTITCLQTRTVHKDLSRIACGSGITNIVVWNYDYGGQLCFTGFGYLGVAIYQVNEVDNESQSGAYAMWMRYYHPYGVTCTIGPYMFKYFGNGITNVEVTQLDYGAVNGPNC